MLNLVKKLSFFVITGLGASSPIVYERTTSPNLETWWRRKLNSVVLIGECSGGDVEENEDGWEYDYKIYLSLEGEDQFDKGLGLKMFATVSTDVIWDNQEALEEKIYSGWNLKSSTRGGIEFVLKTAGTSSSSVKWKNDHCYLINIQKKDGVYSGSSDSEEKTAEDIKFECDQSSKTKGFGWAECDVIFSPETNLKWKDGFKPRLTFSAF